MFVLVDEVESLAAAGRASGAEPSDAIRVVNALLTQLDALKEKKKRDGVDSEMRDGPIDVAFVDRADVKVYVGNPGYKARYSILCSSCDELTRVGLLERDRGKNTDEDAEQKTPIFDGYGSTSPKSDEYNRGMSSGGAPATVLNYRWNESIYERRTDENRSISRGEKCDKALLSSSENLGNTSAQGTIQHGVVATLVYKTYVTYVSTYISIQEKIDSSSLRSKRRGSSFHLSKLFVSSIHLRALFRSSNTYLSVAALNIHAMTSASTAPDDHTSPPKSLHGFPAVAGVPRVVGVPRVSPTTASIAPKPLPSSRNLVRRRAALHVFFFFFFFFATTTTTTRTRVSLPFSLFLSLSRLSFVGRFTLRTFISLRSIPYNRSLSNS